MRPARARPVDRGFARILFGFHENDVVAAMSERSVETRGRTGIWDDEDDSGPAWRQLSRAEAQTLRKIDPPLSPWRVVVVQFMLGAAIACVGVLVTGRSEIGWSLLYGAAVVVVPGALMARGTTSRLTRMNALASTVSIMSWEAVKLAVSVAMLVLAERVVQPLVWPALLIGLVVCIKVYWVALLWRGRKKN